MSDQFAPRTDYLPTVEEATEPDAAPVTKEYAITITGALVNDAAARATAVTKYDQRPTVDEAAPAVRTKAELDALKINWMSDPCWDIETTEGFEAHYDELLAFRLETEEEEERQRLALVMDKMAKLNCSKETAYYILSLERKLADMQRVIDKLAWADNTTDLHTRLDKVEKRITNLSRELGV